MIKATVEDNNATITGTGLKTISTGENYFEVIVTSEIGTNKTYQILVTKDASDNNYLASLYSNIGTWNQSFDKEVNSYTIEVDAEDEKIEFIGTLEDNNAKISGLKTYDLSVGENNISIIVTSESGKTNIYTITVNRPEVKSAYLKDLSIDNYDLDTEFDKELFEYYITVNHETTSLNLQYVTEEIGATVEVTGNENFEIGMNEVHIKVTSSDNSLEEEYVPYVNREMSTNNYLETLTVDQGEINPVFNKETLEYTVEVEREVEKITISAKQEDESAVITTRLGEYTLEPGKNIIPVTVRSSIGISRTYKVHVIRKQGTSNYLSSLSIHSNDTILPMTPSFDKETNTYTAVVPNGINQVTINAIVEDRNAEVRGDGLYTLTVGTNKIEVVVTSESGALNTYVINIIKEV